MLRLTSGNITVHMKNMKNHLFFKLGTVYVIKGLGPENFSQKIYMFSYSQNMPIST